MSEADKGMYVPETECAMSTAEAGEKLLMHISKAKFEANESMTPLTQYLVACFLRHDDDFHVQAQIDWLQERIEKLKKITTN